MTLDQLVTPSEIPWDELKGEQLEECLYWLMDAMGARDLVWRVGGIGGGGPDQGRDLEVCFHVPDPDGQMVRQKWWIEAKGRSRTVEPRAVHRAVLRAAGVRELDVLVIATNARFSNPTRDWVQQWQDGQPRPRVRLWDRGDLEKLVSAHPDVVSRLFASALTVQGRLAAVSSRFWSYCHYADEPTLALLWDSRDRLDWDEKALVAVLAAEMANGDVQRRAWGAALSHEELVLALGQGLLNLLYFCHRACGSGVAPRPYIRAIGYLLLVALDRFPSAEAARILRIVWQPADGIPFPEELRSMVMTLVVQDLVSELWGLCLPDCSRVSTEPGVREQTRSTGYWDRLKTVEAEASEPDVDDEMFYIELHDAPCSAGLRLDKDRRCPFLQLDLDEADIGEVLGTLKKVIQARGSSAT